MIQYKQLNQKPNKQPTGNRSGSEIYNGLMNTTNQPNKQKNEYPDDVGATSKTTKNIRELWQLQCY